MAFVSSSDGVRIHFEVEVEGEGEGTPILLHTGAGGDLEMWRRAGYTRVLQDSPLLLMDHRGHGASDRPTGVGQHSMERYVADVLAVLDAVRVDRAIFVGYSDGALVGSALAAAHPSRVAGLAWIGAVGSEEDSMRERAEAAAWIRSNGMEGLVRSLREEEGEDVPDWFADQMLSTDPEMFALELEGWADWPGPWSLFEDIQAPTLIVVGELEEGRPGVAEYHAKEAAASIPNGGALSLAGLGHVGAFVRSELVLPHLQALIEQGA